jgi:hypothetical protein
MGHRAVGRVAVRPHACRRGAAAELRWPAGLTVGDASVGPSPRSPSDSPRCGRAAYARPGVSAWLPRAGGRTGSRPAVPTFSRSVSPPAGAASTLRCGAAGTTLTAAPATIASPMRSHRTSARAVAGRSRSGVPCVAGIALAAAVGRRPARGVLVSSNSAARGKGNRCATTAPLPRSRSLAAFYCSSSVAAV